MLIAVQIFFGTELALSVTFGDEGRGTGVSVKPMLDE